MIKLIIAMSDRSGISFRGRLPWKLQEELDHFYLSIEDKNMKLLMGRKTYESFPKNNFPNDKFIVLTRQKINGIKCINRSEIFGLFKEYENDFKNHLMISGGKDIYNEFYTYANELIISIMHGYYEADTFVKFDLSGYILTKKIPRNGFDIYYYKKAT